jgi:hypothetical protein
MTFTTEEWLTVLSLILSILIALLQLYEDLELRHVFLHFFP